MISLHQRRWQVSGSTPQDFLLNPPRYLCRPDTHRNKNPMLHIIDRMVRGKKKMGCTPCFFPSTSTPWTRNSEQNCASLRIFRAQTKWLPVSSHSYTHVLLGILLIGYLPFHVYFANDKCAEFLPTISNNIVLRDSCTFIDLLPTTQI